MARRNPSSSRWNVILNNNFFLIDGRFSSQARIAQLKSHNLNNVTWVDGVHYPSSAAGIQSALNAACDGSLPGIVVIQRGTIPLGRTAVMIPNNCDVGGVGQSATKLTLSSSAGTTHFINAANPPVNIRIHDLTLDGSNGTSASLGCVGMNEVSAPTDITIERVTCQNVGGWGINITATSANPGNRIKVLSSNVINAGLATGLSGQLYGIIASFNSHVSIIDNEVANGALTTGIVAFSSINASSSTPIVDIHVLGNRIHDLPFQTTPGAAIDVGRARHVTVANNVVWNVAQGGCVTFESVWGGSITGNSCSVADSVFTGGPIVVKIPDTTQSGEVASQGISIVGNSIIDNSGTATTNGGITTNGAQRNITIKGNSLSYLNQAGNFPSAIFLQLGTNDANISSAGQNFCGAIVVEGNTVTNRPGTRGATIVGVNLQQTASGCIDDQIVIDSNLILGTHVGVRYSGVAASNGITHAYIHDNSVDTDTTGMESDGKTYSSVYSWNNHSNGMVANQTPPTPLLRKLRDQGQCTMPAGACPAQKLAATYANVPSCFVTWTGSGALTGILKLASNTTATPSSSVNTVPAVQNWACFGN